MPERDQLPTSDEVFAEMDAEMDAATRSRWGRTALARAVANAVVAYRTEHPLSQAALARQLGIQRPAVARLELGEHNPSIETLERLSTVLGLRFVIAVTPPGRTEIELPADLREVTSQAAPAGSRLRIGVG